MFPAQTSLIPITVAITKYVAARGFGGNYPFWYLGTTPIKYLTGPIVPSALFGLKSLFQSTDYFSLAIALVFASQLIWAAGWFVFVKFLSGSSKLGLVVAVLVLLSPLDLVLSLGLGETSAILAASFTPWVLLTFVRFSNFPDFAKASPGEHFPISNYFELARNKLSYFPFINLKIEKSSSIWHMANGKWQILLPSLAFALLLLTNTVSAIPAILGLIILVFVTEKKWEAGLKRLFLTLLVGWLLTFWWYSPGYWLTILGAPSIGGRSMLGALNAILGFIKGLAPIFLAVAVVSFGFRKRAKLEKFAAIWLFTFGIFTLFRMFSDIDFWMDWTAWVGELEVGVVLLVASVLSQSFVFKKRSTNLNSEFELPYPSRSSLRPATARDENRTFFQSGLRHVFEYFKIAPQVKVLILIFVVYFITSWYFAWQKRDFWLPRGSIDNTVEYKIANWLSNNLTIKQLNNSTIFLSGTTVFWLNSLVDVKQVRGGVDQTSVDRRWRDAAWEIREGATAEGTERELKALKINYIVVHSDESEEFYHDFKNVERFDDSPALFKIYDENGDSIFVVKSGWGED